MSPSPDANADQITYWNESAGQTWVELRDELDRQIEHLGLRAIDALAPMAGERLLDVGCGCGQTTLALAERVGASGTVLGVDISRPMLEVARDRAVGLPQARFEEADAQTHRFAAGAFDGVFSRFGVMFFEDPGAAFENLRAALKPDGRLAFVCWRAPAENLWMTTPLMAALRHLPPPPPTEPGAPGPFAFADAEYTRRILVGAGFSQVSIQAHDASMGGNSLEDSLKLSLRIGPLGALLRENPAARPLVVDDVRAALEPHLQDGRIFLPSASWIVTARNR